MPFTLAHSAAALPFRRLHLVPSALVIGTLAPDFEYFLRLSPDDRFGHSLVGALILTLPLALAVLWIFHNLVKVPAARLLPGVIQRRLERHLDQFHFRGTKRFLLIVASILLGIATHLLWDSFTHANTWFYDHWSALGQTYQFPILGRTPGYKLLQHGSTVIGTGILLAWFVGWYRAAELSPQIRGTSPSTSRKIAITAVVTTLALAGGLIRAFAGIGIPTRRLGFNRFVGEVVVTAIALVWWQLVAYGLFSTKRNSIVTANDSTR